MGSSARSLTSTLAANVKLLLPAKRETVLTKVVSAIMDNKPVPEVEGKALCTKLAQLLSCPASLKHPRAPRNLPSLQAELCSPPPLPPSRALCAE